MMIATTELSKIFKTGCIDNNQVSCLADALIDYVDEAFAYRFVNKQLDDAEILGVSKFPKLFVCEKFIEVNRLWRLQKWSSTHWLVGVKPGASAMAAKARAVRIAPVAVSSASTGVGSGSSAEFDKAKRVKAELIQKLDKANEELKLAIEAKAKAEAAVDVAKRENAELRAELETTRKALELKCKSLEAVENELRCSVVELKAEKAKNEAMLNSLKVAFPEQVIGLADKLTRAMPPTVGARRVVYLYLGMITADPIDETAFGDRFRLFDGELYQLFKDDPAKLKQARDMFAVDLNPRLTGLQVTWDLLGQPFSQEKFSTSDSFGTEVTEVISALITKPNGSIVRRAKVKTEDINTES